MLKREIMFIIKLSVLQVVRQTWELYQYIWKISFSDNVKNVDSVEICVIIKTISFVCRKLSSCDRFKRFRWGNNLIKIDEILSRYIKLRRWFWHVDEDCLKSNCQKC